VKLDRISLQLQNDEVRTFEFHPGLTVVEAETDQEQDLARALAGTLGQAGDGVHVEFSLDDGTDAVAFRPFGGGHRVVGLAAADDLTAAFTGPDGSGIDLLSSRRSAGPAAESQMVLRDADLHSLDPAAPWLTRLAAADPAQLDAAAEAQLRAENALRTVSAGDEVPAPTAPGSPEPAAPAFADPAPAPASAAADASAASDEARLSPAEEREVSRLERRYNQIRLATLTVGSVGPIAAVLLLSTIGTIAALALIGLSVALTVTCLLYERRLATALDEFDAKREAAAGSATATTIGPDAGAPADTVPATPVDTGSGSGGTDLAATAAAAAEAAQRWHDLAGPVPVDWVREHRDEITAAAALRSALGPAAAALDENPASDDAERSGRMRAAALALVHRAVALRGRGVGAEVTGPAAATVESAPLFVAGLLEGLEPAERATLIELVSALATQRQVILVSSEPEVLSWARVEAMTGSIGAIVSSDAPVGDPAPRPSGAVVADAAEGTAPSSSGAIVGP